MSEAWVSLEMEGMCEVDAFTVVVTTSSRRRCPHLMDNSPDSSGVAISLLRTLGFLIVELLALVSSFSAVNT